MLPLGELSRLPAARFLPAPRRGNSMGALEAGLAPGLVPGRMQFEDVGDGAPLVEAWPRLPASLGLDTTSVLRAAARGDIDVLVLLGADPLNDFVDRDLAYRGLRGASVVVAVDLFVNDSASLAARVVLAAAGPTECDGTFTNLEGRVSIMSRKVTPPGTARADWMIAADLCERREPGSTNGLDSPQAIRAELTQISQAHSPITEDALTQNPMEGVLLHRPPARPARPGGGAGPGGRQWSEAPSAGRSLRQDPPAGRTYLRTYLRSYPKTASCWSPPAPCTTTA